MTIFITFITFTVLYKDGGYIKSTLDITNNDRLDLLSIQSFDGIVALVTCIG